ncbi:MAG: peroxiredoxin [Thermoplasmata archaeon]
MENSLRIGDLAPDFEAIDQNGRKLKISERKGKVVVLYFYPKDFTPGCTAEACNFRDNFDEFTKRGIDVIGISVDSEGTHKKFADKLGIPFILLSDKGKEISKKYNVLGFTSAKRVTFIIDKEGRIAYIFEKVSPKEHAKEVINKIDELKIN